MFKLFFLIVLNVSVNYAQNNKLLNVFVAMIIIPNLIFLAGDWAVYNTLNNLVGTNEIIKNMKIA